ncbi:MAG: hypothetical protein JSV86_14170 [Gemmatimonadota bacterium]|nr:MAG: hypothetical protein JSV86_14170 [Gemmatimonadota bacterium]
MTRAAATAASLVAAFLFAAPLPAQSFRSDLSAGPEFLLFEANSASEGSFAARASGGFLWTARPGSQLAFAVEPRAGLRVLTFEETTSSELIADLMATFGSAGRGRGWRWQVGIRGKVRDLSDPPELPVYLEPGRGEGWADAIVAAPVGAGWMVEARGSAGFVRYTPQEWRVLDRDGALGALSINHALGPGVARFTFVVGAEDYTDPLAFGRGDGRWGFRVDWATSETIFLQLEAALAWNTSNIVGFDYRSHRAALLLSAPLGDASAQVYAGIALKTYKDPGSPDARVAPSDRDTGSFIIVQATQPLCTTTSLHVRGEWSRSETGFRDQYFQRLGFSALLSFRP